MIEKYFLYSPDGELSGITDSLQDATERAKALSAELGSCEVEQVCISEESSSQKRIRVYADGRYEKLWQK